MIKWRGKQIFKQNLARRIMAVVLSGAMVISGMSPSGMTAYAAEAGMEAVSGAEEDIVSESVAGAPAEEAVLDAADGKGGADASGAESGKEEDINAAEEADNALTEDADSADDAKADSELNKDTDKNTAPESTEAADKKAEEDSSKKNEDLKAEPYVQHEWNDNVRITKWDFTAVDNLSGDVTLNNSVSANGILNTGSGTAKWSKASKYLTIKNSNNVALAGGEVKLAIPLDKDTVSVDMSFNLSSNNKLRQIGIGDGANNWLVVSQDTAANIQKIDTDKSYSTSKNKQTLNFATKEDGSKWLYVMVGEIPDANNTISNAGETKFTTIELTETRATSGSDTPPVQPERTPWANVAAPAITSAAQDTDAAGGALKGTVTVKLTADIGAGNGDKVDVILCNESGEAIKDSSDKEISVQGTKDGESYKAVFDKTKLTASGKYTFKAVLSRKGANEGDPDETKESALSSVVDFKLPLITPEISKAEIKEATTDTITVSWSKVDEADYYEIILRYSDEANSATAINNVRYVPAAEESGAESFSKDIAGLAAGSTVKVSVQAFRGNPDSTEAAADADKSAVSAERTVSLAKVEIPQGTKVFEAKNLTSLPVSKPDGENIIPLTEDNYFVLNARKDKPALKTTKDNGGKEWEFEDGYATPQVMAFGGAWNATANWITITTKGSAEIKVWWQSANADRSVALFDSAMTEKATGEKAEAGKSYIQKFEVSEAGTYRIASSSVNGAKGDIRIAKIEVKEGVKVNTKKTFDGASVYTAEIAGGTYADGEAVNYVDDYFTVLYSTKSKVEKKSYTGADGWSDGYAGGCRLNFGDIASKDKNAIKFTTKESEATVKVWWKAGADGRHVQILDADGNAAVSKESSKKDASYITKFKLTSAGTYYLGNEGGNNYLFKVNVEEGPVPDPVAWDSVGAPVIKSAVQEEKDGKKTGNIIVTFTAYIDEINGCEKVTVNMYDKDPSANQDAAVLKTASSSKVTESAEGEVSVSITPDASGTYYFSAKASRASEETTRDSAVYAMTAPFSLPLTKPSITRATNDGKGGMEIAYSAVTEAQKYAATAVAVTKNEDGTYTPVDGAAPKTAESVVTPENKATTAKFEGLEAGKYYAFTVHAVRGEESSEESAAFYKIVKETAEQVWDYAAFGESTSSNAEQCGYSGDVNDGEVSVWSLGGKGKIVPASTDGVSFLYTKVDKDTNFVLEATAVVDEWTYSNGQEGFGIMASDTVGPHGLGTKFWNNSFMAAVTKMEYYWNGSTVLPTSVGPADDRVRYNMYLGIGSIARTGVTDEWEKESAAGATIPSKFVSEMLSLEHAAGSKGHVTGDYNVIGNAKLPKSGCIDVSPLTEIKLVLEKNNTGYFITYIDKDGNKTTHKYYEGNAIADKDYANQSLLQIDKENIYAGFFAARNAKATFKDIKFTTSSVDEGGRPEEKPTIYNVPNYTILSGAVANGPEYEFIFNANWNGKLSVKDGAGRELVNKEYFEYLEKTNTTKLVNGTYETVTMFDKLFECDYKDEDGKKLRIPGTEVLKADAKAVVPIMADKQGADGAAEKGVNSASLLSIGGNTFTVTFTPDRNWHRNGDKLQQLSSYAASVQTLNVSYRQYGSEGTNIYASPDGKASNDGTKEAPLDIFTAVKYARPGQTIVLMKGTYNLKKALLIERGVDGTEKAPIRMIAEPGSYDRTNPFAPSGVVIDFNGVAPGMTISGDYWYFRGFDVTNSADGNKGIQVSGSYNTLDQVNTYYNGNTGIQVNRYRGTDVDKADDWPHDNLILNCTSYMNADSGVEDADGFAAKLTIGDRNVFDGCIAAYNADDGWDLFAKSETGPIGQVVIKNCVAFKNGYLLRDDAGKLSVEGTKEVKAGNGNGFKMGGESIKGYHMLVNSYAFYNKAKGIDANSCPDIQAYNSISFNNMGYNVAFYTGVAKYTEHKARNVISFRTSDFKPDTAPDASLDQLKPVKGKDANGVERTSDYDSDSNFFYKEAGKSTNKSGKTVAADWFKSAAYNGIHTVSRNANGTINLGDFLALTDAAKADSSFVKLAEAVNWSGFKTYDAVDGAADMPGVGGQESKDENANVDAGKDTDGSIASGDDEESSSTDTWTQDEFDQLDTNGNTLKVLLNIPSHNVDAEGYYHMAYTGLALKPAVRVAYGLNELSPKNYSVSYKNNTKAYELRPGDEGFDAKIAPAVVIKGKGNYAGEYNLYFVIDRVNLGSDKVVCADITTVVTGKAQKINPVVTFSGKKLGAKDYEISRRYTKEPVKAEDGVTETGSYEEKKYEGSYESAGTYYIELKAVTDNKGQGNFTGTKTIKVDVLSEAAANGKTPMSKVKADKILDQIYDGTAHTPKVTVQGLTERKAGEDGTFTGDYDAAYYDNTDVGVASVVLTGYGKYYGTKTVTFRMLAKPFNVKDYSVSVKHGNKYYTTDEDYKGLSIASNGSAVTFGSVIVTVLGSSNGVSDKKLTEGVDYTVSYKGNNKAGTASIVIKGIGNFSGKMSRSFKITPLEISADNVKVEPIGDQAYEKGGVKPPVIVKVNGKVISSKNYSVSYKNNNVISSVKGVPASVSITGKNLLKGTIRDVQTFNIVPRELRYTDILADDVYYGTAKDKINNGIAYLTKLTVKDGKKTISLNSDYIVTYYEGKENAGEVSFDYATGKFMVSSKDDQGKEVLSQVSLTKLEKNSKIKYDGSNKTIYAVIEGGKSGLYKGFAYASYKVVGKNDLKYAKIERITAPETYNDAIVAAPKLTVKIKDKILENDKYKTDSEFKELSLNKDYEIVSIKNNDRAGSATITIKGIGYYCGTNKVTFKIDKKDLSAWDAYVAHAVVEDIVVEIEEADIAKYYANGITFDDIPKLDASGNPLEEKEASHLAKAAKGKIYMVGTKTSTALEYGKDFTALDYVNNVVDVSKLQFGEDGFALQKASVTIKATEAASDAGRYTGSRTLQFTIKVKKAAPTA